MKHRLHALLLIGLASMTGCTSSKQIPVCKVCSVGSNPTLPSKSSKLSEGELRQLAARQRMYERRLSYIRAGMTRRQLYAILPPLQTPMAQPPRLFSIAGVPLYRPLTETHSLDHGFSLLAEYRIARASEYPPPLLAPGRKEKPSSTKELDRLLFSNPADDQEIPSRQNPNDQLIARPALIGGGRTGQVIQFNLSSFDELYVRKPPKPKAR